MGVGALGGLILIGIGPLPVGWGLLHHMPQPEDDRLIHQLLCGALVWCGLQMALGTLLSVIGAFRLGPVLAAELLLFLLGTLLNAANRPHNLADGNTASEKGPSKNQGRSSFLPQQRLGPRHQHAQTRATHLWLPLTLITFAALLLFGNLASQPITDYDSLYYHLPWIATLYSTGGLSVTAVPAPVNWYPFGWEALCALFVLPVGSDLLVTLPNLLVWLIWGAAIYLAARRQADRTLAATVALLALTQPLLFNQINTLRVDLALAAVFMAGLYFAYTSEHVTDQSILFCLLSVGLLAALKTSGLLYGTLLITVLLLRQWGKRRSTDDNAPLPAQIAFRQYTGLAIITLLTFSSAAYWYGRNWWIYGNPFGLLEVKAGNWLLWPGPLTADSFRGTTLAALFAPANPNHWQSLLTHTWLQLALPGVLLGGLLLLCLAALFAGRTRTGTSRREAWGALGLMLLLFTLFWFSPFTGDDGTNGWRFTGPWFGQSLRFALPALGLWAICAAWGAAWWALPPSRFTLVSTVCVLLTLAQRSTLYLVASGIIPLLLFGVWQWLRRPAPPWFTNWRLRRWGKLGLAALLFGSALLLLLPLQWLRTAQSHVVYGGLPAFVATNIPPHTRIAALFSHQSYLAAGPQLQRTVVQAPATFTTPAQLLGWLNQHTIELLVVGPLRPEWQSEPLIRWLATDKQHVELLYNDGPTHPALYRIQRSK